MNQIYRDAGSLRHRMTLLANQAVDDGLGGYENNWVQQATGWASIRPAKANSIQRAGIEEAVVTHIIELRQPLDLSVGMRLTSEQPDRIFLILTVSDPDETGRYWRCLCRLEDE